MFLIKSEKTERFVKIQFLPFVQVASECRNGVATMHKASNSQGTLKNANKHLSSSDESLDEIKKSGLFVLHSICSRMRFTFSH